jgi:two-component system, NarL family, sensor histidine kinase EvgS
MKILVVDDDPASLILLTEQLRLLNVEVLAIGNSPLAAGIVEQQKFDGALLDITMPVLSGYDLAKLIRESPTGILV